MNRRMVLTLAGTVLLLCSLPLAAHDDKIHKATIGEIVTVNADGLDLKTKTGIVKVKFSSKTKFELDKKIVDKASVRQGDRAGVIGSKLPTGELMANEVILGVPAPKASEEKQRPQED
jgi:hypothetical protein